jgi:hypothetical protein
MVADVSFRDEPQTCHIMSALRPSSVRTRCAIDRSDLGEIYDNRRDVVDNLRDA